MFWDVPVLAAWVDYQSIHSSSTVIFRECVPLYTEDKVETYMRVMRSAGGATELLNIPGAMMSSSYAPGQ